MAYYYFYFRNLCLSNNCLHVGCREVWPNYNYCPICRSTGKTAHTVDFDAVTDAADFDAVGVGVFRILFFIFLHLTVYLAGKITQQLH
jgi:hypothetical protein